MSVSTIRGLDEIRSFASGFLAGRLEDLAGIAVEQRRQDADTHVLEGGDEPQKGNSGKMGSCLRNENTCPINDT